MITGICSEWQSQIDEVTGNYDVVEITGTRATWQEMFSLYTAWAGEGDTDDWDSKHKLNVIFWQMHTLHYDAYLEFEGEVARGVPTTLHTVSADISFDYSPEGTVYRNVDVTYRMQMTPDEILKTYKDCTQTSHVYLTISHCSVEEMMDWLGFGDYQREHALTLMEA